MKDTDLGVEETLLVDGDAVAPRHVADHRDERATVRVGPRKTARSLSQDELPKPPSSPSRQPWTWVLLALLAIGAIGGGTAYYLYTLGYESTDDAFIAGHVVPISSRVAGHVAKEGVRVTDNEAVKEGELLVELDPRDFEAKLAAAEAGLQAAKAGQRSRTFGADVTEITSSAGMDEAAAAVHGAEAEVAVARAAVATAESQQAAARAQLTAAKAALAQAHSEVRAAEARHQLTTSYLERIKDLVPQHAVSQEALDEAMAKDQVAVAEVAADRQRVDAQEAAVKQAEAALEAAGSSLLPGRDGGDRAGGRPRPRRGQAGGCQVGPQASRPKPLPDQHGRIRSGTRRGRGHPGQVESLLHQDSRPRRRTRHEQERRARGPCLRSASRCWRWSSRMSGSWPTSRRRN